LPEAKGESVAESESEQQSLKRARGDRLPRERSERLDRVRERREGRRAKGGRSQHNQRSEGTEARAAASIETIDRKGREARASRVFCHNPSQSVYEYRLIKAWDAMRAPIMIRNAINGR
jgi:hypothetical protein